MVTNVPVFVPFQADEGSDRWNNWQKVEQHWHGYDVFVGQSPAGPFNISAARNNAASRLDWDLAIFADADTIVPRAQLEAGIRAAEKTRQVVLPHSRWVNVEPHEQGKLFFEGYVEFNKNRTIYSGTKSSILIVPREAYEAVNGYDERFQGWGWEDTAFFLAIEHLYAPTLRFEGNVWHLDHVRPNADLNRGTDENAIRNRQHYRKYQQARNESELRTLISGNRVTL